MSVRVKSNVESIVGTILLACIQWFHTATTIEFATTAASSIATSNVTATSIVDAFVHIDRTIIATTTATE